MKKQIDYGSYASYKETVKGLTENLKSLLGLSEEIALVNTAESIRETLEKTAEEHFEVAIVGEFKRGKSTLINAMLGQEVLPADVLPATATLNRVTYSEEPYVQVEYKNGKSERVDINIPMSETGPDMDMVEELVNSDPTVKGIWCVPKYSNPQGICYSDETVRRFANLKPAAKDFRIFWDNAYVIHHLYEDNQVEILDIIGECEKAGNPDMVFEFASTSKVSFPGSGVSAMATSHANLEDAKKHYTIQTIGNDKVNQLRHARYFKNLDGLKEHMKKHADFMRPKFETTLKVLEEELDGLGIGSWIKPLGGYFISFDAMEGCAKAIVAKCKEAGVILTGAGATFPYHNDPKDSNIRIAPSFPTPEEMQQATEIFVLCVKLVSVEKLLAA